MQVIAVNGSPNKEGVSTQLSSKIITILKEKGCSAKAYHLNSMNIKGCQECFVCRNKKIDSCAVKDDLTELLEIIKTTEVLIVSSPVFYADVSAQLKCFIDRTWSYFGKTGISADHLPKNRTLAFILSYGMNDENIYDQLFQKYKYYFNLFGFTNCTFIKAYGSQYNSPEVMNGAEVNDSIELFIRSVV